MGEEFHYVSEFTLTGPYIKISAGTVAACSAKEDIKFLGLKTLTSHIKTFAKLQFRLIEICFWAGKREEL